MEKQDKYTAATLLFSTPAHQSWLTKLGDVFLSRLSANYPGFYNAQQNKADEQIAVGYEAAWVGIARQVTKNNRIQ